MSSDVTLFLESRGKHREIDGVRAVFSPVKFAQTEDAVARAACLEKLAAHISSLGNVAWFGDGPLKEMLIEAAPALADHVTHTIQETGIRDDIGTCVVTALDYASRTRARALLEGRLRVIDAADIADIALEDTPADAWAPVDNNIYPIDLPDIEFRKGLDLLLMDCPARNLALMPNGLAYVHNALKHADLEFQTFDLDIVAYHHFHMRRIFDEGGTINLPDGRELPRDPWQAEHYDLWSDPEMMICFGDILERAVAAVLEAAPKVLALSVHGCNEMFSRELIRRVKAGNPDIIVLVGGFSCYNADIGLKAVPEADYMCIGEADLTVGPLAERLARGERPKDLAGVVSRFDSENRFYIPGPMPHNLDQIDFPRYEWFDLSLYRNYNGYQLTPVIASRGCRWSRCTFCAERFYWRIRSPKNFVDELEWLFSQGCSLFMFNESDLNGMPEVLLEIADEIIRRGLKLKLTGQLRIHKKSDRQFFDKLAEAGFVALRFGVDAFSKNALRLQKKGYTPDIIRQNLRDCWEAGIFTEVNWVIGVPGERDEDITEGIDLILENQAYIGRLANINPLILVNGSVYWLEPDAHNIKFKIPRDELYRKHPRAIPADMWYSEEPFIDARIRKQWFERIVLELFEGGFDVGAWAERVIDDVKTARDKNRTVADEPEAEKPAEVDTMDGAAKRGKSGKPVMRVDSALGSVEQHSGLPANYRLVRHGDDYFAADAGQLATAFTTRRAEHRKRRPPLPEAVRNPRNLPARLFAALPDLIKFELIQAYRSEKARIGHPDMPSPAMAASMIARGLVHRAIKSAGQATGLRKSNRRLTPTRITEDGIVLTHAVGKDATPMLMCVLENYNIVEFDGTYFGVPQGIAIEWDAGGAMDEEGVFHGDTVLEVMTALNREKGVALPQAHVSAATDNVTGPAGALNARPTKLSNTEGYQIVAFEGWVYGIPERHGDVDITMVDPLDLDGVVRDVSAEVVQSEIAQIKGAMPVAQEA